jgi:hypothetical protein
MQTEDDNNIMAEPTIIAMITNNKKLLDTQISRATIQRIVTLCKRQKKNERVMKLLSSLATCQGEAVVNNQNNIVECFLEDEEIYSMFKIPIRKHGKYYQAYVDDLDGKDEWVCLKDISMHSYERNNGRFYNFLLAYLELAANLCYQRNYKGIICYDKIYRIEEIYYCSSDTILPYDLRAKFTSLMLH